MVEITIAGGVVGTTPTGITVKEITAPSGEVFTGPSRLAEFRRRLRRGQIRLRGGRSRVIITAKERATIRTSRAFRPAKVGSVKFEKLESKPVRLLFSASLSPKVRAIKVFETGADGLEGARRQRFENLKTDLAREKSRLDAQAVSIAREQANLSREIDAFNKDQERLQRLANNNLLQPGVAVKNKLKGERLNDAIKALNEKSNRISSNVSTFNEGVQSLNRTEQRANVKVGKTIELVKSKPTAFIAAAPPRPTVTIQPETFVRPTFGGEILFPDDTRRKAIQADILGIPQPITRVSRDIELGIQTGLESAVGVSFAAGQALLGITPQPVRRVAARALQPVTQRLLGDLTVEQARERVVPTTAAILEIGTLALPGGVGVARRVQAAAAFGDPFDLAAGVAVGGVTRLAKSGSQFLKLIGGTGDAGRLIRFGEKAIGKGLLPAFIGAQAIVTGAELRGAIEEPEEIRRIGRETAGGLGAFLVGAQIGGLAGEQLFVPLEASLARQTALKQLKPGEQKTFEKFFDLAKQIDKVKITPKSFNLATERLTKREAQVVTKFLKENTNVLVFGSASIVPQLPKNIARTIKPKDIDLSARDFEGVAERIAASLRASGSKRVSLIKKASGTEITIDGKKAIEVKPRERLIANIGTVRGPLEFPFQSFTKTADGVSILKLGPQAKRQAIGGALEQPQLREKDLIRLERIAGILTPQQAAALRKGPKISLRERADREFRALIGDTRGELLPTPRPVEKLKLLDDLIITEARLPGVKPSVGRRPRGQLESLLGFKAETTIFPFPSKLPVKQVGSALGPADFSRLIEFKPTGPSALPTRTVIDSIVGIVPTPNELLFGPSRLPPPRRITPPVTLLPPVTTLDIFSFLPPPIRPVSRLPPPSRLPPVPPLDPVIFDPGIPKEPGIIPPPGLPTFDILLGTAPRKRLPFDVFIKTKVAGKRKFRRANRKPLSRSSALGFGSDFVDRGVERSFFIQPSTQKGKARIIAEFENAFNPFKFRSPKRRSKLPKESFVERTGFAIDTIGELRGITFKGLAALERRRAVRGILRTRRRKRKPKTKRRKR